METHSLFQNLSRFEVALLRRPAFSKLLHKTFEECGAEETCSPLQREFLLVTFSHAYHHFGFEVFSPLARNLLVSHLARVVGCADTQIEIWLETLCYQVLEDFHVLKITSGEPTWHNVDDSFAIDFVKRVIATESSEQSDVGLSLFDSDWVADMRSAASFVLAQLHQEGFVNERALDSALGRVPYGSSFTSAFRICLSKLARNPLLLLAWRLESFAAFAEAADEARFFLRRSSVEMEDIANSYAAVLALLLPYRSEDAKPLFGESPVSLTQMTKILKQGNSERFDVSLLRGWLQASDRELSARVTALVRGACKAGLVFEVQTGRNQRAYGLTRTALRILQPFSDSLQSVICARKNETAA